MSEDPFLRRLVYISLVMVFVLVTGIFFGPWEIDPQVPVLLGLVAQPGSVALGALLQRRSSP